MLFLQLLFNSVFSACPTNATDATCASFMLPDANATSLSSQLCTEMPRMVGCSLSANCQAAANTASYCSPFSLYTSLCTDMPGMSECKDFASQCGTSTSTAVNKQCTSSTPLSGLPTTSDAVKLVYDICKQMNMDGCQNCQIKSENDGYVDCDIMSTYVQLCQTMPTMTQCSSYNAMCKAAPSLSWCTAGSSGNMPPMMQMFFHGGITDYILFQNWVPRNNGDYAIAWIITFIAAMLHEALHVGLALLERVWANDVATKSNAPVWSHIAGASAGFKGFKVAFIRGFIRFVSISLSYILMLVVMTFNVGLFFAVVVGYGAGTFVFAPMYKLSVTRFNEDFDTEEITKVDCH
ncbi:hypothetical protein HDV06_001861 [Boothiomyces sp. JEL0866]|nr:hypothetical protein HDV06_001861 [Boothiomyces sp. JEL0866]